jgi:hypothetical protein
VCRRGVRWSDNPDDVHPDALAARLLRDVSVRCVHCGFATQLENIRTHGRTCAARLVALLERSHRWDDEGGRCGSDCRFDDLCRDGRCVWIETVVRLAATDPPPDAVAAYLRRWLRTVARGGCPRAHARWRALLARVARPAAAAWLDVAGAPDARPPPTVEETHTVLEALRAAVPDDDDALVAAVRAALARAINRAVAVEDALELRTLPSFCVAVYSIPFAGTERMSRRTYSARTACPRSALPNPCAGCCGPCAPPPWAPPSWRSSSRVWSATRCPRRPWRPPTPTRSGAFRRRASPSPTPRPPSASRARAPVAAGARRHQKGAGAFLSCAIPAFRVLRDRLRPPWYDYGPDSLQTFSYDTAAALVLADNAAGCCDWIAAAAQRVQRAGSASNDIPSGYASQMIAQLTAAAIAYGATPHVPARFAAEVVRPALLAPHVVTVACMPPPMALVLPVDGLNPEAVWDLASAEFRMVLAHRAVAYLWTHSTVGLAVLLVRILSDAAVVRDFATAYRPTTFGSPDVLRAAMDDDTFGPGAAYGRAEIQPAVVMALVLLGYAVLDARVVLEWLCRRRRVVLGFLAPLAGPAVAALVPRLPDAALAADRVLLAFVLGADRRSAQGPGRAGPPARPVASACSPCGRGSGRPPRCASPRPARTTTLWRNWRGRPCSRASTARWSPSCSGRRRCGAADTPAGWPCCGRTRRSRTIGPPRAATSTRSRGSWRTAAARRRRSSRSWTRTSSQTTTAAPPPSAGSAPPTAWTGARRPASCGPTCSGASPSSCTRRPRRRRRRRRSATRSSSGSSRSCRTAATLGRRARRRRPPW